MKRAAGWLAAGLMLMAAMPVQAWTAFGHRLVARLAQDRLSPQAEAQMAALLSQEPGLVDLAALAAWADEVRKTPAYEATGPFHYVTFRDGSCHYAPARDCPDGACVVGALERYTAVLGDVTRPAPERLEALKFVVHFAGDIHQPMHAGNRDDRGGNRFQVNIDGKGTNLHAVWDYDILAGAGLDFSDYRSRLAPQVAQAVPGPLDPARWAEESCALLDGDHLYPARPGTLPAGYLDAHRALVEQRLVLAAARLAAVLDQALSRLAPEPAVP